MTPLKIFIGYDHRQTISYSVLQHSIVSKASVPVSITPLVLPQLPIKRHGLTPFTYSRFLVPYLCEYRDVALFLDADMLMLGDVAELFSLFDSSKYVQIVRHDKTFEWASVMLFNCNSCWALTPHFVETGSDLHRLSWCPEERIGDLPHEWNHLVGYDDPRDDPKLIHYTQGVPFFPETRNCEHSGVWHEEARLAMNAQSWPMLMGRSVHAVQLEDGTLLPRLHFGEAFIEENIRRQHEASANPTAA